MSPEAKEFVDFAVACLETVMVFAVMAVLVFLEATLPQRKDAYDYPGEVSRLNCSWDASRGPLVYRSALPCTLAGARVQLAEPVRPVHYCQPNVLNPYCY